MLFSRGKKELVEIIGQNTIKKRKKFLVKGNQVIINKGARGRGQVGWKPKYNSDCYLYYNSGFPFFRLKRKLQVDEGAKSCRNQNNGSYEKYEVDELFSANVIKHAGETKQKIEFPIMAYLLLAGLFFLGALQILMISGRVTF